MVTLVQKREVYKLSLILAMNQWFSDCGVMLTADGCRDTHDSSIICKSHAWGLAIDSG